MVPLVRCKSVAISLSPGIRSVSSMDDVFFDAESTLSSYQSRSGLKGGENRESDDAVPLHPSFASLGSLSNVDESSGSEEDDMVTAAADEGIFAIPGNRSMFSTPTPGRTPSPSNMVSPSKFNSCLYSIEPSFLLFFPCMKIISTIVIFGRPLFSFSSRQSSLVIIP